MTLFSLYSDQARFCCIVSQSQWVACMLVQLCWMCLQSLSRTLNDMTVILEVLSISILMKLKLHKLNYVKYRVHRTQSSIRSVLYIGHQDSRGYHALWLANWKFYIIKVLVTRKLLQYRRPPSLPPSLPPSVSPSVHPSLPPSVPPSLPHSLTRSLARSLTHSLTHSTFHPTPQILTDSHTSESVP